MWVILSHLDLELDHPTEAHGFEELYVCENQQNYSQISVMHLNSYKSLADCMISALLRMESIQAVLLDEDGMQRMAHTDQTVSRISNLWSRISPSYDRSIHLSHNSTPVSSTPCIVAILQMLLHLLHHPLHVTHVNVLLSCNLEMLLGTL
jgi:hypothetical protein